MQSWVIDLEAKQQKEEQREFFQCLEAVNNTHEVF